MSTVAKALNSQIPQYEVDPDLTLAENPHPVSPMAKTAYEIAKLAPKLIFSGIGWAIGFAFGANLGAGIGDALGTFIGSAISFLIVEQLIGRIFHLDPQLESMSFTALAVDRLQSALILSAGCFFGGLVFNTALTKVAGHIVGSGILVNLGKAIVTGGITAAAFLGGTTAARFFFINKNRPTVDNFLSDLKVAFWIILPAETAFVATALPLLGAKWLMGSTLAPLKAGASVLIGGEIGAIAEKTWNTLLDRFYQEKDPILDGSPFSD